MRFFKRLIVLLIVYRLAAASTFGIVTWYYKIALLENPDLQLYGGIAAGILSLLIGLLLVIVKKKKKPAKSLPNETKKIETASVVTAGDHNGLMVDEIPQQPDLPAMPEYEPLDEEPTEEEVSVEERVEEQVIEEYEPEAVPADETYEEVLPAEEPVMEAEPEIEMIPEPEIPEETAEIILEEPVIDEIPEAESEEEVIDFMAATRTMPVITPEEEEVENAGEPEVAEEVPQETESENVVEVNESQEPEKVKKIFVDDTTQIISTASLNDYLKKIRENRDLEVTNANAIKNDIILPLGPREAAVNEEDIPVEEVVVEEVPEQIEELQPQKEEMVLRPLEETEDRTETLSRTQEQYITQSTLSYIDESGKPQFRVTEEIKTVREDESQKKGFEGFDVKAERAEKWANFLNGIITILVMALVLILLYYLYNRFFA